MLKLIPSALFLTLLCASPSFAQEAGEEALPKGVTIDKDGMIYVDPNFPENVPGGVNLVFKYDAACQSSIESAALAVKKKPNLQATVEELTIAAEELDGQLKIVTDANEKDLEFRASVMYPAQVSAQSLQGALATLKKAMPNEAKRITRACRLSHLKVPLEFSSQLHYFFNFAPSVPAGEYMENDGGNVGPIEDANNTSAK